MSELPPWLTLPQRKPTRAAAHDYSTCGAYAITFCIEERIPLLGKQEGAEIRLNGIGRMIQQTVEESNGRYRGISLDCYCVMPEHVHMIVWLLPVDVKSVEGAVGLTSIPQYMNRLKSFIAHRYRAIRERYSRLPEKLLQRGYYDRYIRDERELNEWRAYILNNPLARKLELDAAAEAVRIAALR